MLSAALLSGLVPCAVAADFTGWTVLTPETSTISQGGQYYLSKDVTVETLQIESGITVTLDLNGHVLSGDKKHSVISNLGSLTIQDSAPTTEHYFQYNPSGAWSWLASPTTSQKAAAIAVDDVTDATDSTAVIKVTGGAITGGKATYGGGINNGANAELFMTGCTVVGNAASGNDAIYGGGGIINWKTLSLTNTAVLGNTASKNGGGLYSYGVTELIGVKAAYNHAGNGGGGLYVYFSGTATVSQDTAIQHNRAAYDGGGVYQDGSLILGGNAVIADNHVGDTDEQNLFLPVGKTVTLSDNSGTYTYLDNTDIPSFNGSVSVLTDRKPTTSEKVSVTSNGTEVDLERVVSESKAYKMIYDNDHLALEVYPYTQLTSDTVCLNPVKDVDAVTAAAVAAAYGTPDDNKLFYAGDETNGYSYVEKTDVSWANGSSKVVAEALKTTSGYVIGTIVTGSQTKLTAVTIDQTAPKVTDTLTATAKYNTDNADAFYQWYRGDSPISDATAQTYTVTTEDIGQTLKVTASGSGSYYGTVTSDPTSKVPKLEQTKPVAAEASHTGTSVTLQEQTGYGAASYGYSTDSGTPPTNWQSSTEFTGLATNTTYYFFVKLAGNEIYNEAVSDKTAITPSTHSHTWTYSASGQTLTATCSGEGSCNATQTVTISANDSTYDGKEKTATLTGSTTTLGDESVAITYYEGTTQLNAPPVDAGSYTAKVTAGGQTAEVFYTVKKAANAITLKSSDGTEFTGSAVTIFYNTALPITAEAVNGTPTMTITKGGQTVAAITDCGTYQIKWSVAASDNYDAATEKSIDVTVKGKNLLLAAVEDIPVQTYTGQPIKPTVMVKDGDRTLTEGTDYVVAYSGNTDGPGTATITLNGNYSGTLKKTFVIHKHIWAYTGDGAVITAACVNDYCDYSGNTALMISAPTNLRGSSTNTTPRAATLSGGLPDVDTGSLTITYQDAGGKSLSSAPTDAGTYTASVTAKEQTASVTFTLSENGSTGGGSSTGGGGSGTGGGGAGGGGGTGSTDTPSQSSAGTLSVSKPENGNVTVGEITAKELANVPAGEPAVIKADDGNGSTVSSVSVPKSVFETIAEAGVAGLDIQFSDGTEAILDAKTIKAIAKQAKGQTIQLVVNRDKPAIATLNAAQEATISRMNKPVVLDAFFVCDGVRIADFMGGEVTLIAAYPTEKPVRIWYVMENGEAEQIPSTYDGKFCSFMVTHFSHYVAESLEIDETASIFEDVPADAYYAEAVSWAVENGITEGVSSTCFAPLNITTRAQMVTFLWRSAGSPEPVSTVCPFVDVPIDSYFYKAVLWGYENVYVKGTSATTFTPDATVTRGQAVAFLARLAGIADEDAGYTHPFTDVLPSMYYHNAVAWASSHDITTGIKATTFAPDNGCKRGEVVTLLFRSIRL